MLVASLLAFTHVPTYGGCVENCCVPPRHYHTSQVIYLQGPGGLELHTDAFPAGEVLDVDAVFRDNVTDVSLHIGCGGCVASQDAVVEPPYPLAYDNAVEVEPFTQTAYRSLLPKDRRTYNTSLLTDCTEGHFTIRLVDHDPNRTRPIVWAPVIGLGERFTAEELFLFPLYILRNHGAVWNDLAFTYWLWLGAFLATFALVPPTLTSLRDVCYGLAAVGFLAAAAEEATHLLYAQVGHPIGYGLWVGLFAVIGVGQGAGLLMTMAAWKGRGCCAHPAWAPVEVLSAVSLFFLFGSGFFLGPAALGLAGLLRWREWARPPRPPSPIQCVVSRTHVRCERV